MSPFSSFVNRFILAVWSLLVLALSSYALSATAGNIVVGQAIDLSGPDSAIGRDYVAGIKTHFDAINSAGGINGRHIQYIVRDDLGQADGAVKAVSELIERDQVDYLFGGVGENVTQAVLKSPVFKRSGLILFAPLASANDQSRDQVLFWRPGYKQELRHIFAHFGKLGIKDVAVVLQDSASTKDAYSSVVDEIRARNMRLTGTANIGASGAMSSAAASKLAATKPGFVVVIGDTIGTSLFLKEFRKLDAQTFVAGTSLINLSTLRELVGARAAEWTVFSQVVPNPNAATSPIQMEHMNMMKKYRDEPLSSLTLEGFAAAKSLTKTIQQLKKGGRSALHELIAQNGDFDLGGLSIVSTAKSNHLSNYLDIALFKKGSGLMF